MKKDKLYTVNKYNQTQFARDVDRVNNNIFDGMDNSFMSYNPNIPQDDPYGVNINNFSSAPPSPFLSNNYSIGWNNPSQGYVGASSLPLATTSILPNGLILPSVKPDNIVPLKRVDTSVESTVSAPKGMSAGVKAGIGAAGALVGQIGHRLISNGFDSGGVGDGIASIGGAAGGIVSKFNPVLGAAISAGTGIIGGVVNRGFGVKKNKKNIARVDNSVSSMRNAGNLLANAATTEDLINRVGNVDTGFGFKNGFIAKNGWFNHKGDRLANKYRNKMDTARGFLAHGIETGEKHLDRMNDDNAFINSAAFGGLLDSPSGAIDYGLALDYLNNKRMQYEAGNKISGVTPVPNGYCGGGKLFDIGGDLQTHGADWSTGSSHIDAGGTHEENPYQGVQVGVDPQGTPNLVEEGEVIYNDYVYSKRILCDDETKEKFHISKKREITFADLAKKLEKEISERPNDPISKAGFDRQMAELAEEQERQKQEMQAEEAREAFDALSPEEQVAVMQQADAQAQEEQQMQEQEAMAQQEAAMQQQAMQEQAMMQQQGMGQPMGIDAAMMAQQGMPMQEMPIQDMAYGGLLGNQFGYGGNLFKWGGTKREIIKWLQSKYPNMLPSRRMRFADDMFAAMKKFNQKYEADPTEKGLGFEYFYNQYHNRYLRNDPAYKREIGITTTSTLSVPDSYYSSASNKNPLKMQTYTTNIPTFIQEPATTAAKSNAKYSEEESRIYNNLLWSYKRNGLSDFQAAKMAHQGVINIRNNKNKPIVTNSRNQSAAAKSTAEETLMTPQGMPQGTAFRAPVNGRSNRNVSSNNNTNIGYNSQTELPFEDSTSTPINTASDKKSNSKGSAQMRRDYMNAGAWKTGDSSSNWGQYTLPGLRDYLTNLNNRYNATSSEEEKEAIRDEAIKAFNEVQQYYANAYQDTLSPTGFRDAVKDLQTSFNNIGGNAYFGNITDNINRPKGARNGDVASNKWTDGLWGPRTSIRNLGSTEYGIGDDNYYSSIIDLADKMNLDYKPNQNWKYGKDANGNPYQLYGLFKRGIQNNPIDNSAIPKAREIHYVEGDYDQLPEDRNQWVGVGDEVRRVEDPEGGYTYVYHQAAQDAAKQQDAAAASTAVSPEVGERTLRYIPKYFGLGDLGPVTALAMQIAGIGAPKDTGTYAAVQAARHPALATMQPIGNKEAFKPFDRTQGANSLVNVSRGADRSILNSGSGSGINASLLANAYNRNIGLGDMYRKGDEYNDALRRQVEEFNRGTDQANATAFNQMSAANAQLLNSNRNTLAALMMQKAREDAESRASWYNGIYGNIDNLFKGIGAHERENRQGDILASMANLRLFGEIPDDAYLPGGSQFRLVKSASEGGKLNKKKRRKGGLTI